MNMVPLTLFTVLLPGVFAPTGILSAGLLEEKLQRELLAPCCYRETVDHHMSEAATAIRAEIREMVARGKSERQILELYKSRYGARILAEPEGAVWWVGTLMPLFALAIGTAAMVRVIFKWRGASILSPNR